LATIKPAEKVAPLDRPSVGIIRGNKAEAVKQE
jgi:hypothetical protein